MANPEYIKLLKQSIISWNSFRGNPLKTLGDLSIYDVKSVDLSGANLSGADLRRANLIKANLSGANLGGADLGGANLTEANFKNADLREVNFKGAILKETNLCESNLCGTNLGEALIYKTNFSGANLKGANLLGAKLKGIKLNGADLNCAVLTGADLEDAFLQGACLRRANLSEANLISAYLKEADLRETDLRKANLATAFLNKTDLRDANLKESNLSGAQLIEANLSRADLRDVNLIRACLIEAKFNEANLSGANFRGAILEKTSFVNTNIDRAIFSNCHVYGINIWDLKGKFKEERDLIITPEKKQLITIDNVKIAQFIYLFLENKEIQGVMDTLTSKSVLILGRFSNRRKNILDALKKELRELNLLPIIFDFDCPVDRDTTETIKTLSSISYFVIADITNPKSSPLELQAIVPDFSVPVIPIIQEDEKPFSMMVDLQKKYHWVLDTVSYDSKETLIKVLEPAIINPAIKKYNELKIIKSKEPVIREAKDFLDD